MAVLAFDRTGTGIPLVFIHAFPLSRRMWDVNKPALSKNFQFISVDLPGFGDSSPNGETATMEDMARRVMETLDGIGIKEKCVISGVSMGGYVCFQLMRLFPERIRAMALLSTRSAPDTPETKAKRFQTIELVQKGGGLKALAEKMLPQLFGKTSLESGLPIVNEVRSWIEGANPEAVCASLRGMAERPDSTPLLSGINIPVLVISGAEDNFIKSAEMEQMANMIKTIEFQVLTKAGHLLTLEKPEQFNEIFLRFLKRRVL